MTNLSQDVKNNLICISHTVNHLEIDIAILQLLEQLKQHNKMIAANKYLDRLTFERVVINCCKLVNSSKSEKLRLERIAKLAISDEDEKINYISQVEDLIQKLDRLQFKTIRDKFIAHSDEEEITIKTWKTDVIPFGNQVIEISKRLLDLSEIEHIDYSSVRDEINDFLHQRLDSSNDV